MDVSELKNISDRSYMIAVAKKDALEKARSSSLLAYSGHLFQADATLINLIHILKQSHKEFVVLDSNDNPMMVDNPTEFLEKLIAKNQEALNLYHQLYNDTVIKG